MTVIDAHAHLWRRERTPQPWIDPESMAAIDRDFWLDDLVAMQRSAGIDGSILVQSAHSMQETVDLLAVADGRHVLGVVGWVDLADDVPAQLADLAAQPGGEHLVGIRHLAHQDEDPAWLRRPQNDFAALAAHGLPFDLVVRPEQLETAAVAVAANPGTCFVLDHVGNPPIASGDLSRWRSGIERLAGLENTMLKISGITLQADADHGRIDDLREPVQTALDLFGPERTMFGSDWPLVEIASDSPSWLDIVRRLVPAEAHDAVFAGTARRVYFGRSHAGA